MALYTGKGDGGTTKVFNSSPGERMSKSSPLAEALGTLDEVNSYLGLCKIQSRTDNFVVGDGAVADIVHELQDDLFIVQAEVAGAPKKMPAKKVAWQEKLIHEIETRLPPIKTFFISGGTELSSRFDFARTLARRAERRVVFVHESGAQKIGPHTLAYLNRLSSTLYALARFANHQRGISENAPDYK